MTRAKYYAYSFSVNRAAQLQELTLRGREKVPLCNLETTHQRRNSQGSGRQSIARVIRHHTERLVSRQSHIFAEGVARWFQSAFNDFFYRQCLIWRGARGTPLRGDINCSTERTVLHLTLFQRQVTGPGTFTAMLNAFFISLVALVPGYNLAIIVLIMGIMASSSAASLPGLYLLRRAAPERHGVGILFSGQRVSHSGRPRPLWLLAGAGSLSRATSRRYWNW